MALNPAVTGTYPSANASGIPVNMTLSGFFNIPMDPTSITDWTFLLTDKATGSAVQGTVSYYNTIKTIGFTPKNDLYHYADYMAIIVGGPAGAKAFNGNSLPQSYSWEFKTGNTKNQGSTEVFDSSGFARPLPPSATLKIVSTYPEDYSSNLGTILSAVNIDFNAIPASADISKYITVEVTNSV